MKTVGSDGIPNEFYKEGGEKIEKGLHVLFESSLQMMRKKCQ